MDNGRKTSANRRLAKKRAQGLNEALCFVSSSVLTDSLVLPNPLLRQAPNRSVQEPRRTEIFAQPLGHPSWNKSFCVYC